MTSSQFSYSNYVEKVHELFLKGVDGLRVGNHEAYQLLPPLVRPQALGTNPTVLILAPHPDDECLMGGYPLRMKEEWGAKVRVCPFTYGSRAERQEARRGELNEALSVLGFELLDPRPEGSFEKLNPSMLETVLENLKPDIIFTPHAGDGHRTHQECYQSAAFVLTKLAQNRTPGGTRMLWVQTEYWAELKTPNTLISYSARQVAQVGEALSKHVGEVSRNPYHLRLPAWYMDQVRRGSEILGGKEGAAAVQTVFGQLFFQSWV